MIPAILRIIGSLLSVFDKRTRTTAESESQRIRKENEKAHREIDSRIVDARGIDTR